MASPPVLPAEVIEGRLEPRDDRLPGVSRQIHSKILRLFQLEAKGESHRGLEDVEQNKLRGGKWRFRGTW